MATYNKSLKFTKVTITQNEDGDFIVEELKKDETVVTNLSKKILGEFLGLDGLEISIGKKTETASEE